MNNTYFLRILTLIITAVMIMSFTMSMSSAQTNESFVHSKTGVDMRYYMIDDNSVKLGNSSDAAISTDTIGKIIIPRNVTNFLKWETVEGYKVKSISANAFLGCDKISEIYIEGDITLEKDALKGLNKNVAFVTSSHNTEKALKEYGIDDANITYKQIKTRYVVFGDSIAAGYALPEYDAFDALSTQENDGDRFPTPVDAFAYKTTTHLNSQAALALLDNQAVSGWTSQDLLTGIQNGEFDEALKDADIVSLTIGSNDLLGPFITSVYDAINKAFGDDENKPEVTFNNSGIMLQLKPGGDTDAEQQVKFLLSMEKLATAFDILNTGLREGGEYYETLMAGCENFKLNTQKTLLKELKARAPQAQIYWTTLYNPFACATIDCAELFPGVSGMLDKALLDRLQLDLNGLGAMYIEKMNEAFDINTQGYTKIDLYDIFKDGGLTNVDIRRDDNSTKFNYFDDKLVLNMDPHPNTEGHNAIYKAVSSVFDATYTAKADEVIPTEPNTEESTTETEGAAEDATEGTTPQAAKPNKSTTDQAASSQSASAVKTGDLNFTVLLAVLMIATIVCTFTFVLMKRKFDK